MYPVCCTVCRGDNWGFLTEYDSKVRLSFQHLLPSFLPLVLFKCSLTVQTIKTMKVLMVDRAFSFGHKKWKCNRVTHTWQFQECARWTSVCEWSAPTLCACAWCVRADKIETYKLFNGLMDIQWVHFFTTSQDSNTRKADHGKFLITHCSLNLRKHTKVFQFGWCLL